MKIVNAEIFRFSLPLSKPLTTISKTSFERTGLLLKLVDDKSNAGFGEISPLPGLHSETLDQAEKNLLSLLDVLKGDHPKKPNRYFNLLPARLAKQNLYPSVQFGLEMAFWNLMPEQSGPPKRIKVNGLLSGRPEEILTNTQMLFDKGYNSFKLKVGREDIDAEINLIHQLRNSFGNTVHLRLDANRVWDFEQAIYFGKNVANEQIEYIEEPLKDYHRLDEFFHQTNVPFAVDESFFDLETLPVNTKALILKPSFIGGIQKSWEFIKLAQEMGIQPVISSSFESGLGLLTLARLAGNISGNAAMGLDTFHWFNSDLIEPAFSVQNGYVEPFLQKNVKLNNSLIEKVI